MNRQLNLVCAECGDPIGVYEPFWRQDVDGSVVPSASPAAHVRGDAPSRYFHDCCPHPAPANGHS